MSLYHTLIHLRVSPKKTPSFFQEGVFFSALYGVGPVRGEAFGSVGVCDVGSVGESVAG